MKGFAKILLVLPVIASAEVTLDGSLSGSNGDQVQGGNGFTYDITENLGSVSGNNLFHSFADFNVATGESANYSAAGNIANVITRVTGGNLSTIDGTVSSSIQGASFWFFNPSGLVVGQNAVFDFDGSINLGTFDTLIFEDDLAFSTVPESNTGLSIANPAAFGFLSPGNTGDVVFSDSNLSFNTGQTVEVVGRNVTLDGATLSAEQGEIGLTAFGEQQGQVAVVGNPAEAGSNLGTVTIENSSEIEVNGPIGGQIRIEGGEIILNNSSLLSETEEDFSQGMTRGKIGLYGQSIDMTDSLISANARPDQQTGQTAANLVSDIELRATDINLQGNFNFIFSNAFDANSTGGELVISGQGMVIDEATVSTSARNQAAASSLRIEGGHLEMINGADITADVTLGASPGSLIIDVDRLDLASGSTISADGFGDSAAVEVQISADTMSMGTNTEIAAQTTDNSGGGITLDVVESLSMSTDAAITTENFGRGAGADIRINVGNLVMEDGAQITASALNIGNGGNISISADNAVRLIGEPNAESGTRQTEIASKSGDAFREQTLFDNPGYGEGDGGSVLITANSLSLSGGAGILSTSERFQAYIDFVGGPDAVNAGDAGEISIGQESSVLSSLNVSGDSRIATSAPFSRGGNIQILVSEFIGISDSAISAFAGGTDVTDSGGNIFIDPELFFMRNAEINANANGGNGGNIQIVADNIIRDPQTSITASSNRGIDGDITIDGVINDVSATETEEVAFSDVVKLLSQKCTAAQLADRSSFVVSGNRPRTVAPNSYELAKTGSDIVGDDAREQFGLNLIASCFY